MNKLISTDLHGFPFVLDDLRFIDNGIREAFRGVHSHLLDTSVINDGFIYSKSTPASPSLSGGANYYGIGNPVFPETFCNINGEIFKIPATTLNFIGRGAGDVYCIEPDFSFDVAGLKTFEDTNTHDTYQIRRAKLVLKTGFSHVAGTDIPVLYFDDATIDKFIQDDAFSFLGRTATALGVMDNTFVQAFQSGQISALQTSLNGFTNAWTSVNYSTLYSKIFLNSSSTPSNFATDSALSSFSLGFGAGSYLKFKKNGRVLHVDFKIESMILPEYNVKQVALINIDLTGIVPALSNVLSFSGSVMGFESDRDGTSDACISGNVFQSFAHISKPRSFAIVGISPNQFSNFAINKSYDISSSPYPATSTLDSLQTKWNFYGSFTCEIN